jgi:hypothetical protein
MKPTFFKSGAEFRGWLERHRRDATELSLGILQEGVRETWYQLPWYQRTSTYWVMIAATTVF